MQKSSSNQFQNMQNSSSHQIQNMQNSSSRQIEHMHKNIYKLIRHAHRGNANTSIGTSGPPPGWTGGFGGKFIAFAEASSLCVSLS